MRRMIPNLCTSANLLFGMCSILSTFHGDYFFGSIFILIALVADGLDGRIARALGVVSELGKEMDSLCDLGSFGIAPAFLAYSFCMHHFGYYGWIAAILFALCGMWRLARFNVNTGVVHGYFMGLAIPAGGCIVASTTLLFLALDVHPDSAQQLDEVLDVQDLRDIGDRDRFGGEKYGADNLQGLVFRALWGDFAVQAVTAFDDKTAHI